MKTLFILFFTGLTFGIQAQDVPEPEEAVIAFFNAFHQQDTLALRDLVHNKIKMQSIGEARNGDFVITNSNFNEFLNSIAAIPESTIFQEQILDYRVQTDGVMANVWTPYEFYINKKRSHCGVTNFQLILNDNQWKIFYIVDTRKRKDCDSLKFEDYE